MVLNGVSAAAVATVTAIGVATVLPIVAKEAGVVKMPSAVVAAASLMKAGKTVVAATAVEVNRSHLK